MTVHALHAADLIAPAPAPALDRRPHLSAREIEVLLAWIKFDSKHRAAEALFISPATVSTHIARIRHKYTLIGRAAPTKAQLVVRALQDGYTTLDEW